MRRLGLARRRYVFTEQLREALRDAYRAADRRTRSARLRRVRGLRPGWPDSAWADEAQRLGLCARRGRRWTAEEDRALLAMAGHSSSARIAARFGRSVGTVKARAAALELSLRMREGFTAADLARCFGVPARRAAMWIERGLLGRVLAGSEANPRVSEVNVRRFIKRHSQEYDLRSVDQTWFCSVAFGGAICRD